MRWSMGLSLSRPSIRILTRNVASLGYPSIVAPPGSGRGTGGEEENMRYGGFPFVVHWTDSEASVEKAQGVRASAIAEWHHGNYTGALIGGLLSSVARTNGQGGGDVTGLRAGGLVGGNDGDLTGVSGSGLYNYGTENLRNGISLSLGANGMGGRLAG